MKKHILIPLLFLAPATFAQQKIINQAIVNTTTNIIAPEEDDLQNPGGSPGGMNFRNIMDGETKSVTYLKNDLVKTVLKSDVGRSTIIRNNSTKITTTLLEIMGNKTGFYVSDSEQTDLRKKADSVMQSRQKKDSAVSIPVDQKPATTELVDLGETKKIAGYNCKKALVITTKFPIIKDTVTVWYTNEIKLQNISSTGGLSGFGNMGAVNGLEKIDGFVMRYEMNMRRDRRMEVEVTKIDTSKEIADKEFEIPKDFEVKPMKDMRGMFGGGRGFQMQRGN